jgi:hypothetical protein
MEVLKSRVKALLFLGLCFVLLLLLLPLGIFNHHFKASGPSVNAITINSTGILNRVRVHLSPIANVTFYECAVTGNKGNSTLPGLNISQSAQRALTDNNPNTVVFGKDVFDIVPIQNISIMNLPGPDLVVTEMGGPEQFSLSIYNQTTGIFSHEHKFLPIATSDKNVCHTQINRSLINLDSFGVPNNSSVPILHFDNLRKPGCCPGPGSDGSEIADVTILHQKEIRDVRPTSK